MIIDKILDRKDGFGYAPKDFYNYCLREEAIFPGIAHDILVEMDYGTNKSVQKALCEYITFCKYNPAICDYINSEKWV